VLLIYETVALVGYIISVAVLWTNKLGDVLFFLLPNKF